MNKSPFRGAEFNSKLHISLFDSIIKDNERIMQARGTENDSNKLSDLFTRQEMHKLIM